MTLILSGTDSSVSSPAVQGGTAGTTTGVYYPATNQLALATNGTQAVLVDSSQNVGIGTSSPGYKLDVAGASGVRIAEVAAQNGFELAAGSTVITTAYNRTTNTWLALRQRALQHEFYTNGTETMRIDSSGNVGIGVTPSSWYSTYRALSIGYSSNGMFSGGATQLGLTQNAYLDSGLNYVYTTSNPTSQYIQQSGVHTWRSAASGTAGNAITFTQLLAVEKDKSLALQGATSQTGIGISFPATQSASSNANTLDDYEEGTVTYPLILGGSTITSGYSQNSCKYVKIGNSVNCVYLMDYTGSSGVVTITLPFAVDSTQAILIISSVYSNQYGYTQQCLFFNASSATAALNTGIDPNTPFTLATGNRLYIRASFLYLTN